jgi:hypothetical protein
MVIAKSLRHASLTQSISQFSVYQGVIAVKRRKPPALTSPWKIGFFVSLMLVFVAIGVAYFFTRRLGTPWSWPQPSEWRAVVDNIIHGQGFLVESWPVLVLVGATSLVSYLIITQAVRKYKRYLDSGHDYKRLLATIREIQDLDDGGSIDELHNHPELRDFLTKIRADYEERTRMLDEREKALEGRVMATEKKKEQELSSDLNEQCGRLIEAIVRSRTMGFPDDVGVTLPELTLVEDAIRNALAVASTAGDLGSSVEQQSMDYTRLRKGIEETWRELQAVGREMKALEGEARETAGRSADSVDAVDPESTRHDMDLFLASCSELEKLSAHVAALGEETRSVAINTALQAGSGRAKENDMVKLAEDVKELASSYGELSKTMSQQVNQAKRSAGNIGSADRSSTDGASAAAGTMGGKLSLLAERLMVVTEKVNRLLSLPDQNEARGDVAADDRDVAADDGFARRDEFTSLDSGDEFQSMEEGGSIFSSDGERDSGDGFEVTHGGLGSFGGEEDDGMFAELSDRKSATASDRMEISEDEFAMEAPGADVPSRKPADERPQARKPADERPQARKPADERPQAPKRGKREAPPPRSSESAIDTSGLELEPGFGQEKPSAQASPVASKKKEQEADVIDLYELGAVDYDPVAHG